MKHDSYADAAVTLLIFHKLLKFDNGLINIMGKMGPGGPLVKALPTFCDLETSTLKDFLLPGIKDELKGFRKPASANPHFFNRVEKFGLRSEQLNLSNKIYTSKIAALQAHMLILSHDNQQVIRNEIDMFPKSIERIPAPVIED